MASNNGPMTEAMYYVLLALSHPSHGYQLMSEIKDMSGGRVQMGPGTLYGVLVRMQKEKLIRIKAMDHRRKTYELTEQGKEALQAEYKRLKCLVQDGNFLEEEYI